MALLLFKRLKGLRPNLLCVGEVRYLMNLSQMNEKSDDDLSKKIIYSSMNLETARWNRILEMRRYAKEKRLKAKMNDMATQSVSLKFLPNFEDVVPKEPKESEEIESPSVPSVMPIGLKVVSPCINVEESSENVEHEKVSSRSNDETIVDGSTVSLRKSWSNDYINITHRLNEEDEKADNQWVFKYGTSNPCIPSSKVPCGGCGALLHCKNASIPGFIPQEVFTECNTSDLRTINCQRCYFLQNHNTALSVAVDSNIYPKIISHIKNKKALVLLAVDLTDFPCSIWPGITDLIGLKCPIFLVGNKVDLLWGDGKGWMLNVEKSLKSFFPSQANIIGTHLISAKTGFGVEELISKLHDSWGYQGDVYLIGCTNVGKSTLFNALLQSDYCKVKAVDLVLRATTSIWPGTTLNLLKFPILRPEGWRVYLRSRRLKIERTQKAEALLRKQQFHDAKRARFDNPQLIGHIGRSFLKTSPPTEEDEFSSPDFSVPHADPVPGSGLDPNDPDFVKGKWFYDTPGVLHNDQILDLLTTEELMKVLPQKSIEPRTVIMKPGWSLFVGGLARVDYLKGSSPTRWTVFVSRDIPITICFTEDAESVYAKLLGTETLCVPMGDGERLNKWPALNFKDVYKFCGISKMQSCGDLVLSSCGWVSLTADRKEIISVRPWTPEGRGIYTRAPSLLPFAVNLRGILMRGTPAYSRSRAYELS